MKIFDLSHTINESIPVYPGTPQPDIRKFASLNKDGFRETILCFSSHTGTHIDAPYHMVENGKKIDQFPPETFTGRAAVVTVPAGDQFIERKIIVDRGIDFQDIDFLLFCTGWSKYWGSNEYFTNFPVLSDEAIELLLSINLKGVGFDTISVDRQGSTDWKIHLSLLGKGMIIVENLNIPEGIPALGDFFCFPLLYGDADGSPVRAVFIS
jgi:kynurenine formamidase